MTMATGADIHRLFLAWAEAIEADKDRLSALDGVIGDGDHGVTMALGFEAVVAELGGDPSEQTAAPSQMFMQAAKTFLNAVGASVGPLYATGFMRAAAAVKGHDTLDADALAGLVPAISEGIIDRGKAEAGQKTMADAWLPAAEAARTARETGTPDQALEAAAAAAQKGAEATAAMMPGKGRSANLGERAVGHVDPGAASAALLIATMAEWASDLGE